FHTVSAKLLSRSEEPLDEDVLLAGDDPEAKAIVAGLADRLVEGRAVDAGRLEVARWLETLTAVLLNVNRAHKANAGVRITGLEG
ncbi:MAG: NADPH-dependent F420 reductase, partial [Gaiellaceae bacterium]